MIYADEVTKYNRTQAELEEFWLFCLAVAGKTANTIAYQLDNFLPKNGKTPFENIRHMIETDTLLSELQRARLGQYSKLTRAYTESLELDLKNATIDELEQIHGVGPKTSRFFVLHSRANVSDCAVLDTHVLWYLNLVGYPDIPKATPGNRKRYRELEKLFLQEFDMQEQFTSLADFDLALWKEVRIAKGLTKV